MLRKLLLFLVLFVPVTSFAGTINLQVTFNYDFTGNPACSGTVITNCVSSFRIYQTDGTRTLLGSVALPANPTGIVTGITGTLTPAASLGLHTVVAVAAATMSDASVLESNDSNTATFYILPGAPTSFTAAKK